jgi:imidazolonepropionase-like amidohydrolase
MVARMPGLIANSRTLLHSGAPITAGTDAGIGPIKPPDVLRWAIALLVQLGLPPVEALRTATSQAAAVCGLGRLAPGYDADVLALDGNPLDDLTAMHRIRAVYCRGTLVLP